MIPPSGPRYDGPAPRAVEVRAAPAGEVVRPVRPVRTVTAQDAPTPVRRRASRRLDVRRDLIAAELLAPPVSLRQGGVSWR